MNVSYLGEYFQPDASGSTVENLPERSDCDLVVFQAQKSFDHQRCEYGHKFALSLSKAREVLGRLASMHRQLLGRTR